MIINSLLKSIKTIISNPLVLLPSLILGLFLFVITNLAGWAIERPLIDLIIYNIEIQEMNLLFLFLTQYPLELITIIAGGFVSLFLTSVCLIILANYVNENSLVKAIDKGVKEYKKAFSLTILLILISFLGFIIYSIFSMIFDIIALTIAIDTLYPIFAWIFMIITLVILAIIFTKISFVIPALIKNNPKDALKLSWEFTNNKFWSAFIFIIILALISFLVINIFELIGFLFDIESILSYLGDSIILTFTGLAIANYYLKQ